MLPNISVQRSLQTSLYIESLPCVWLVAISNDAEQNAAEEAVEPDVLPALVLVLLAGFYTPEPAAGRVVVVFMRVVAGASYGGRGELSELRAGGDVGDDLKARPGGRDQAGGAE